MHLSQGKIIGALLISGILIIVASVGIWAMFINDDAPSPVSLQEAVASLETPTATNVTGVDSASASTATDPLIVASITPESAAPEDGASVTPVDTDTAATADTTGSDSGTTVWGVASGSETFVGYRIGEELATIGTTEAVGRTSAVTGAVTINGSIVESATIEANMQELTSDDSRRDTTLQDRGLETATYPTASFVLTESLDLGGELTEGAIYSVIATGELNLHGVTRPVEIQMEAQYVGGTLVVVGSLEIELSDYNIVAPTTRIALAVDDHGTLELQLILSQTG